MRRQLPKIAVLLLLPAFLLAGFGNAFASSWCVSASHRAQIEKSFASDCGGCCEGAGATCLVKGAKTRAPECAQCYPCLDFSTQPDKATLVKRFAKIPVFSIAAAVSNAFTPMPSLAGKPLNGNPALQLQTRISQAILAHRTVVLLN